MRLGLGIDALAAPLRGGAEWDSFLELEVTAGAAGSEPRARAGATAKAARIGAGAGENCKMNLLAMHS